MSYQTARTQLVSIVEDVTPSDNRLFSAPFRHDPTLSPGGKNPTSRSFCIEANMDGDGGVTGPFTPDLGGQPRLTFSVTLTVFYRDFPAQRGTLDEVLASDQRALSIALLKPENWDRSTSLIHSITDSPLYLPTRRIRRDGAIEMRTFLSLWFS